MSEADRKKWDARYAGQDAASAYAASALLDIALERMARERGGFAGLRALDLACGSGRNSLRLAELGFNVDALDVSAAGLALGRAREQALRAGQWRARGLDRPGEIDWLQADLNDGLSVDGPYDLIVIIRYLDLALLAGSVQLLRPGGVLVVELFMDPRAAGAGNEVSGPRNPDFLIAPGVLGEATAGLSPWLLEEGVVATGAGRQEALARFVGCA